MGSVINKLNYLEETKTQLKDSLIAKGASITDETPLSEYAPAIENIQSGGGAQLNIAFGENPPEDTTKLWVNSTEPNRIYLTSELPDKQTECEAIDPGYRQPEPLEYVGAAVGDSVYLLGHGRVLHLQPETGVFTEVGYLPVNVRLGAAAVVGKKIYYFGGNVRGVSAPYDTIMEFDTETCTAITLETKMPVGVGHNAAVVIDNKVYLLGGLGDGSRDIGTIYIFDPVDGSMTNADPTWSTGNYWGGGYVIAAAYDGKIFFGGGRAIYNSYVHDPSLLFVLDTRDMTVRELTAKIPIDVANMHSYHRYGMTAVTIGDMIYLLGGSAGSGDPYRLIHALDPRTEELTTLDTRLPLGGWNMASAVVGDTLYMVGGYTAENRVVSGSILSDYVMHVTFRDTYSVETGTLFIHTGSENRVKLIDGENATVSAGINKTLLGDETGKGQTVDIRHYQDGAWETI